MRKPVLVGVAALALVGAVGATFWWLDYRLFVSTDDAYLQSDIAPIAPKVAGYVARIEVTDDQAVQAGDVLLRLVDDEYRAKVDQARATVDAKAAALENLARKADLQSAMVDSASAAADSAAAELKRARLDQARMTSLMQGDFASRQKAETADADRAKGEAAVRGADARIAAEKAQLAVLDSERLEGEAALAQAKASLALAEQDLANTVIRAPTTGVVGNRAVVAGQYARIGAIVMSIVPMDDVWVEANFKETQLTRMSVGQTARVQLDAYPGIEVTGRVQSMAPASGALFSLLPPENASGNFTKVVQRVPVKIVLPRDSALAGRLRPGLSVHVTVDTHAGRDAAANTASAEAPVPAANP